MSIYTSFEAKIRLRLDTPFEIVEMIEKITSNAINETSYEAYEKFKSECATKFDHAYFRCLHWDSMLNSTNNSDILGGKFYKNRHNYWLCLDTEFREYHDEIEKFLDFIKPYIVGRKQKQYIGKSKMHDYRHLGYTYYAIDCAASERSVIVY